MPSAARIPPELLALVVKMSKKEEKEKKKRANTAMGNVFLGYAEDVTEIDGFFLSALSEHE